MVPNSQVNFVSFLALSHKNRTRFSKIDFRPEFMHTIISIYYYVIILTKQMYLNITRYGENTEYDDSQNKIKIMKSLKHMSNNIFCSQTNLPLPPQNKAIFLNEYYYKFSAIFRKNHNFLKVLLFLRMYLIRNHRTKTTTITTNFYVPSWKEFKSVFLMVLKDSSFQK